MQAAPDFDYVRAQLEPTVQFVSGLRPELDTRAALELALGVFGTTPAAFDADCEARMRELVS